MFIDTHTHLYQPVFDGDRAEMMQRAAACGVTQFYLPGIDSEAIERMLQMEQDYPQHCKAMMGLHPCSVNASFEKELAIVQQWLKRRKFPAIGEIGLDFHWDKTFIAEQYSAFERQMQWALDDSLPVVIHTRSAMEETINTVKPFSDKGLKGIFHCFGGTAKEAQQIVNMGFLLGIGGVLTYKNSHLGESLTGIGLEHIVLETDAPYLSPVPHRGKRNESSYLPIVAAGLAALFEVSIEEVATITSANARSIFAY